MGIGIEIIPFNTFLSCNFCVYIRNDFRSLKCEIAIYPQILSCAELRKYLNNRFGLSQIISRHNPFEPSVDIQEKYMLNILLVTKIGNIIYLTYYQQRF